MDLAKKNKPTSIKIETIQEFKNTDLTDLCDAAESTITDGSLSFSIGLSGTDPLVREKLETYWKGVLIVPERQLIIARIDDTIAASIQLIKPAPQEQTSSFAGSVDNHFVAPWARGHGLAKSLLNKAEQEAKLMGLTVLKLSVRGDQQNAINLYQSVGYQCWGKLEKYEQIDGKMYDGRFYFKEI